MNSEELRAINLLKSSLTSKSEKIRLLKLQLEQESLHLKHYTEKCETWKLRCNELETINAQLYTQLQCILGANNINNCTDGSTTIYPSSEEIIEQIVCKEELEQPEDGEVHSGVEAQKDKAANGGPQNLTTRISGSCTNEESTSTFSSHSGFVRPSISDSVGNLENDPLGTISENASSDANFTWHITNNASDNQPVFAESPIKLPTPSNRVSSPPDSFNPAAQSLDLNISFVSRKASLRQPGSTGPTKRRKRPCVKKPAASSNDVIPADGSSAEAIVWLHCDKCSYSNPSRSAMQIHGLTHKKDRRYKCDLCPFSANQKFALKQHVKKSHQGRAPLKCPHWQYCSQAFLEVHDFMQHVSKCGRKESPPSAHQQQPTAQKHHQARRTGTIAGKSPPLSSSLPVDPEPLPSGRGLRSRPQTSATADDAGDPLDGGGGPVVDKDASGPALEKQLSGSRQMPGGRVPTDSPSRPLKTSPSGGSEASDSCSAPVEGSVRRTPTLFDGDGAAPVSAGAGSPCPGNLLECGEFPADSNANTASGDAYYSSILEGVRVKAEPEIDILTESV